MSHTSSIYGRKLRISIFGQSHSAGIGVVIDGLPAGFAPDMERLAAFMARRAPGKGPLSTRRREADEFEVLSGLAEGKTCGAPFCALIRNTDARPGDYAPLRDAPRPGHADYAAQIKYGGFQDAAGGGHFSGRLTAPMCLAGGLAVQLLAREGVRVAAHVSRAGGVSDRRFDMLRPELDNLIDLPPTVLDPAAGREMAEAIERARLAGDSLGGEIECAVVGLPAGLGEPMFDGLENRLAQAIFAIPAVKGLEFGEGFACRDMRGSEHNDAYIIEDGRVGVRTNHAGGILGGISTGLPIIFRAAVKPTPSIALEQDTVSLSRLAPARLSVPGRHDPCIAPRATPCVEAAAALAVYDAFLDK